MNIIDIPFFRCLKCGKELSLKAFEFRRGNTDNIQEGVLFCPSCKTFYPITEGIPFLLDSGYYEYFDTKGFVRRWADKFDFGNYTLLDRKTVPEKLKQLNFYNVDSDSYDDLVSHSKFWKASDWNILRRWFVELPAEGMILDIGCGTGRCTIPLAKKGRRIIGTDLSIGMLRKAVEKSEREGLDNITYFLADAEELPFKTELFSTVISFGLLHHVNKPASIIQAIDKLLKDKGVFYALENNASPLRPIFDAMMKFRKLWNEEAGSHPLFRAKDIKNAIVSAGMRPEIRVSTFLPPHLFNFMSTGIARKVISFTDYVFGKLPVINNFGGQLVIKAVKNKINQKGQVV